MQGKSQHNETDGSHSDNRCGQIHDDATSDGNLVTGSYGEHNNTHLVAMSLSLPFPLKESYNTPHHEYIAWQKKNIPIMRAGLQNKTQVPDVDTEWHMDPMAPC
jgi:hypothetical protein